MTAQTLPFCRPRSKIQPRWALLTVLVCSTTGCDLPGKPKPRDQYVPPHRELQFSVLYEKNCSACHGATGKLGPAPPLNDPLFLALVSDMELRRVITEGRAGTLMPPFASMKGGHLTDAQVKVLAEGIKQMWRPAEPAPRGAPPYLTVLPSPDSGEAGNKEEGLKVFARACASCHGNHGQGGTYAAKTDGRPVGAINNIDFLTLISDQALRRYVITGRPDLGMPDYAGSTGRPQGFKPLTSREVTDIVALLASWRQGESFSAKRN